MKKIDQILDSLYDRVIEPTEAKEQLLDLFGVSDNEVEVCDCATPSRDADNECCTICGKLLYDESF